METKDVQHACSGSTSKITTNCSFTWCQLFFYQWNTLMKLLMFCSLWPGKTACCHRYWSTLVQVMVWCFSSTSPLFEPVLTNELHWAYNFQFQQSKHFYTKYVTLLSHINFICEIAHGHMHINICLHTFIILHKTMHIYQHTQQHESRWWHSGHPSWEATPFERPLPHNI